MRVDVKKFLFIGLDRDRERFFGKAQKTGIIHFIEPTKAAYKQTPEVIERILTAIKVVRGLPTGEQEELYRFDQTDFIVDQIISLHEDVERCEEEERILKMEISRIQVFGDFDVQDLDYLEAEGGRNIQFYCAGHGTAEEHADTTELIHVGSESGLDYFVGVHTEPKRYQGLIEMKIEKSLSQLKERLATVYQQQAVSEEALKVYAKYYNFLHESLKVELNAYNLDHAQIQADTDLDDTLFSVEGWVPKNKRKALHGLLEEMPVHAEEVAIEDQDAIPTYLENEGAHRIGEDLVHIYDTPGHTDKDPSMWVLCFFALFFSIIVGDGGYGLVFLAVALYLRKKFSKAPDAGRRVINLVTILAVSCIGWGLLTNSFFGVKIAPDHPARSVSLVNWLAHKKAEYHLSHDDGVIQAWQEKYPDLAQAQTSEQVLSQAKPMKAGGFEFEILDKFSDQILLEIALFIGIVHVTLSFMRYLGRNWAGIGWILFLAGAFLYFPDYLGAITWVQYVGGVDVKAAAEVGIDLIGIGLPTAVVLSLIQNRLLGLIEITNAIQVFGDILSYLRLYALGLASAIVSVTVNEMAMGLPVVLGAILVIVGHSINMVLAIAGGVIHGLRLNFLEWYHYSFEGGGRLFKPLKRLKISLPPGQAATQEESQ